MARIITLTPNPALDYAVSAGFVEPNRKIRCKDPQMHPGGGGINIARATSRLGAETLAIFTTGGVYGDALAKAVDEEHVNARIVPIAGNTRLAFHVTNQTDDNEYRFNLPGAQMRKGEAEQLLAVLDEEVADGDYVAGSGSLPPGAPTDFWASAARITKQKGARFVLDSVSGLKQALDEGIFLLRQNQHEYPTLAGRELSWPDEVSAFAARVVKDGRTEKMAITYGGEGSVMASKDGLCWAPVANVKLHSAVGAGDSFVGGLLTAMLRGFSDADALLYASAAAGATRMTAGTALFERDEAEQLYRNLSNR